MLDAHPVSYFTTTAQSAQTVKTPPYTNTITLLLPILNTCSLCTHLPWHRTTCIPNERLYSMISRSVNNHWCLSVHSSWHHVKDPANHLSTIIFVAGHDHAEIMMVPFKDGILHLEHWLSEPRLINLYASSSEMNIIGIQNKMFKQFPTSHAAPLTHTYTVFYWIQGLIMPINWALLRYCTSAEEYRMLYRNVVVLKNCQSLYNGYDGMTTEDIVLVGSVIGR